MAHVRSVGKCLAAVLPAVPAAGAQSLFAQSVGPFTREQALQGKALYEKTCAACHGPALSGRRGAAPDWRALPEELEPPTGDARRPALHPAHDDAAPRGPHPDGGRARGRVRATCWRETATRPATAVAREGAPGLKRAPRWAAPPRAATKLGSCGDGRRRACRRRRTARHGRPGPSRARRGGGLDGLAALHARLRGNAPLAAEADRRHERRAAGAGLRVPGRRAGQLPGRSARPRRDDVPDHLAEHDRDRRRQLPAEVAPHLDPARRGAVAHEPRRRAQGRAASCAGRRTATSCRSAPRRASCSGHAASRIPKPARRSRWRRSSTTTSC